MKRPIILVQHSPPNHAQRPPHKFPGKFSLPPPSAHPPRSLPVSNRIPRESIPRRRRPPTERYISRAAAVHFNSCSTHSSELHPLYNQTPKCPPQPPTRAYSWQPRVGDGRREAVVRLRKVRAGRRREGDRRHVHGPLARVRVCHVREHGGGDEGAE